MSGIDRYAALLGRSLRLLFKRERDRRRYANSPYAWLFQPYMGEELVALACQVTPGPAPVLSIAAVVMNQQHIQLSHAWVATFADAETACGKTVRRHQELYDTQTTLRFSAQALKGLAEFIGNRPLIGWQLEQQLAMLNSAFRVHLGFGLPNAQVDVARLHQRQLRRRHPLVESSCQFPEALACWQIPTIAARGLLGKAAASALLYMRLQRDMAQSG
ncbi:DNA polymerase-3 subunit epsilon [Vreelandella songnenensis]|uniref:DNA polymerase-3 subunit epsilon n=1 Tax=Vreelandella songnenensis TaxID=1176243 RepID=A0A2T0V9I0_9GAMM|nr:DNA polymerase III subunit epsilon [Halomonas songnenensis]PRY66791.1 DNA polymerase-3 subunit epsilon [Halomonas songnenensis]